MPVSGTAPDGQFEFIRVRFRMEPGMPKSDAQRDLSVLGASLRQASKAEVVPIVATLRARTKIRATDPDAAAFSAEVIVRDLAAYPIDVVKTVCDEWPTLGTAGMWFPSWAELYQRCERLMQPRRALAKALQWVVAGEPVNAQ